MKRPLVACLVGYAWVSEPCASSLNRQLGAFSTSIDLTKTGEIDIHIINVKPPYIFKGQRGCRVLDHL